METDTEKLVVSLLGNDVDPIAAGAQLRQLGRAEPLECAAILSALSKSQATLKDSDPAILGGIFMAFQKLAARCASDQLGELDPMAIAAVEQQLPAPTPNRFRLLYALAAARNPASLKCLAEILCQRPPANWIETGQLLSPLYQGQDWSVDSFFPAALGCLEHRSMASPLLDLANWVYRQKKSPQHPFVDRKEQLSDLLAHVVGRLGRFEEDPRFFGDSVEQVQRVLNEAVALAISLCDALGLIGWEGATGRLYQAMELRHRRVQTEAAGALASLGVEAGKQRLVELAAEPAARLRVLTYADELGCPELIDDSFRTPAARAEAEMALWRAQPQNMGTPPSEVSVISSRRLYWPSFDSPVDCHLVRFNYHFGDRSYSNIGITGPLVHAIAADLTERSVDDIYAIYAGWHVEHPDIFRVEPKQWNAAQQRLSRPLLKHLDRIGLTDVQPSSLGFFLGEHALIVRAKRDNRDYLVITDGSETLESPVNGRNRQFDIDDVWHLYLGQKMLRTFNDPIFFEDQPDADHAGGLTNE
jgi:hypothetical protein